MRPPNKDLGSPPPSAEATAPAAGSEPWRDRATWTLYGLLGMVGYLLTALGAVLVPLQRDLQVGRAQVAFYPSLFAAGLVVVGLGGTAVVTALGRVGYSRLSLALMAGGAVALVSGVRPLTMAGAALLGLGAAGIVQLVPAALTQAHGPAAPTALGEANAVSSAAAVAGPLCVGAAIGAGIGWQAGFLAVPLLAAVALTPMTSSLSPAARRPGTKADGRTDLGAGGGRPRAGDGPAADDRPARADGGPILGAWVDLLLAISVEFCVVFWAPDALTSWHGAGTGAAAALAALFVLGMALVRSRARRLLAGRTPQVVTAVAAAVAIGGFAGFWLAPDLRLAAAGLFVTGMGVALLYPLCVARVVAAWPDRPDAAAGRAALASAAAIGVAPLVLATAADAVGLRAAYLLVPGALGLLLARATCHTVRR